MRVQVPLPLYSLNFNIFGLNLSEPFPYLFCFALFLKGSRMMPFFKEEKKYPNLLVNLYLTAKNS